MLYAKTLDGEKIKASPGKLALCPICDAPVQAKCGEIKIWHWSHQSLEDCDAWSEGESKWHLGWKDNFSPKDCEVKIGNHRADIKKGKTIIELQNSPISVNEIQEREKFYGRMVWLFNKQECQGLEIRSFDCNYPYASFRWKHPTRSIGYCKAPTFLDLGWSQGSHRIFWLHFMGADTPCGGWGYIIEKSLFLKMCAQEFRGILRWKSDSL